MCNAPIDITQKLPKHIVGRFKVHQVSCGSCPSCLRKRSREWQFRLLQELWNNDTAHFVTYTYNEESVPLSPSGQMTLRKQDLIQFKHALRKDLKRNYNFSGKLKYYQIGEYGGLTKRPHYHEIIFGLPNEVVLKDNYMAQLWAKGRVDCDPDVNQSNIGYVTSYLKKTTVHWSKLGDREKEFSTMSKHIGASWLTDINKKHHRQTGDLFVFNILSNERLLMPRYYRDKIWNTPKLKIELRAAFQMQFENEFDENLTFEQECEINRLINERNKWELRVQQAPELKRTRI